MDRPTEAPALAVMLRSLQKGSWSPAEGFPVLSARRRAPEAGQIRTAPAAWLLCCGRPQTDRPRLRQSVPSCRSDPDRSFSSASCLLLCCGSSAGHSWFRSFPRLNCTALHLQRVAATRRRRRQEEGRLGLGWTPPGGAWPRPPLHSYIRGLKLSLKKKTREYKSMVRLENSAAAGLIGFTLL
jgi:hypothetical protein